MPNSPRMGWPFPTENQDPWFDVFVDFVQALDASGYAAREDRSLVLGGGGTVGWNLGTSTLQWSDPLNIFSPIVGVLLTVPANTVVIDDGQVLFASLVRGPSSGQVVAAGVASQVPSSDKDVLLAVRVGSRIHWRNGLVMDDGESVVGLGSKQGGGALEVEDEGISVDPAVVNLDFVGAGVTASQTALGHVEINIPGGAADRHGPSIIVGNSSKGDTSAECHFLDTGNCAGLAAAIASAGAAGVDVYVRPGDYDFGAAGAPAARISVPANVRVRGAGRRITRILTRAAGGDGRAFTLGEGASLEDLQVYCPTPTANQVGGYEIIEAPSDDNSLIRVDVKFENNWATIGDATWAAVNSAIGCYGARPNLIDCKIIDGPKLYDLPWGSHFYGVYCYAVEYGTFRGIYTSGLDQAFYYDFGWWSDISDLKLTDFRHYGAVLMDGKWDNVRGVQCRSDGVNTGAWGFYLAYSDYETVTDVVLENGGTNAVAIWLEYASRNKLDGCRGDGSWGTYFLRLSSSSNYNVIIANQFAGDAVSDSGTGNDFGHNQA